MYNDRDFSELKGKTLKSVVGMNVGNDEIFFTTSTGEIYRMWHKQNCCESVTIDDVCGEVDDILNEEILIAEEVTNRDDRPRSKWDYSYTWTFYKLATRKGYVTIRWYGTSNGYYSENVDFTKV